MPVKAVILAAGVGARLGVSSEDAPKVLLSFGGETLLSRHVGILAACGVDEIVIGVGYHAALIEAEIAALGASVPIRTVLNERYREGSIVTLWTLRHELVGGSEILLMDADVLYDRRMIDRLLASRHGNCLLSDAGFRPGDEPVKICVRGGRIVEFRKQVRTAFDTWGESVGFFRLSPAMAGELAARSAHYVDADRYDEMYEEAIRDLLLDGPGDRFGFEDVTGLPWTEIDFPDDLRHAEENVLPRLLGG